MNDLVLYFTETRLMVAMTFPMRLWLPLVVETTCIGCHRRNGPNFGRVFLMLNYTDLTQNTYVQS